MTAVPIGAGVLTAAEREAWEERAAIMEFDGGLSRADAEAMALRLVLDSRAVEVII